LRGLCSFSVECYLLVNHNYHKIVFVEASILGSIRQKAVNCLFNGKILSLLMECPIAKNLHLEAMQHMLYTCIQNKRIWADAYYTYNKVRMVLKLSELHCYEPGIVPKLSELHCYEPGLRGTSAV